MKLRKTEKILILICIFLVFWIAVIFIAQKIISSSIEKNWYTISQEKTSEQKNKCFEIYDSYRNDLDAFTEKLEKNVDVADNIYKSEQRKLMETVFKLVQSSEYNIEIYNKNSDLLTFTGNQLKPDFIALRKALSGEKFTCLKEVGLKIFLVNYLPIYNPVNLKYVIGVAVIGKYFDSKLNYINDRVTENGFCNDYLKYYFTKPELFLPDIFNGSYDLDSVKLTMHSEVDLKDKSGIAVCKVLIPFYSKENQINDVENNTNRYLLFILLLFSVLIISLSIILLKNSRGIIIKAVIFTIVIIVIRYLWLWSGIFSKSLMSDIFSPNYYASLFGFGIAKSLGELLITSILFLILVLYYFKLFSENVKYLSSYFISKNKFNIIILNCIAFTLIFLLMYFYSFLIQSLIFDSNVKFVDYSTLFPSSSSFCFHLIVLLFSFIFFSLSIILILFIFFSGKNLFKSPFIKNFRIVLIFILLLISNYFIDFIISGMGIIFIHRLYIIVLIFAFCINYNLGILKRKTGKIFSVKGVSYIILICIIITPVILFQKIRVNESKYVEKYANNLVTNDENKVVFTLSSELNNLMQNKDIDKKIKSKSIISNLAYLLWSETGLNYLEFGSSLMILDTNGKILSDFNINSPQLINDSIVGFLKTEYFLADESETEINSGDSLNIDDEGTESLTDKVYLPNIFEEIDILKNLNDKYYVGIAPIENKELKNTQFSTVLGYLVIAINTESKNIFSNSSLTMFENNKSDNLLDKLLSVPSVTEFTNGEITNATNSEVSRMNANSLEPFRNFIKESKENSIWRFESNNDKSYKTFYINDVNNNYDELLGSRFVRERIYSVSIQRDDFPIFVFFFFRFLIISIFIWLVLYFFISSGLFWRINKIKFGFREKLLYSFIVVSVIPIILLAFYTRSFIKNKNEISLQNQIISDLNIYSENFKNKKIPIYNYKNIDSISNVQRNLIDKNLIKSNKNFNLYLGDKLVSTTNDEVFKSDLLDNRLNSRIYYNVFYLKKDVITEPIRIGENNFLAGYMPLKDKDNIVIGTLSSISIYRQNDYNRELTETLTFIFGSYILAIIILLIVVNIFTERLARPVTVLKESTERLAKGQTDFEIKIKRNDELGSLVDSFNKMTKQISRSKVELKKAEREAAWREIARRVAHEIKNPLTPMKLSIQHLYKIYKDKIDDTEFEKILTRTKNIISIEIDKLKRIASDFSDFAKMPMKRAELLIIDDIINEVTSLYSTLNKIDFKLNLSSSQYKILGDKEELNRVFQNIITNSIQAIEDRGIIEISTRKENDFIIAEIKDNGTGIDEEVMNKLFTPDFSTKIRGMGLGLAITKKSLDDMGADIKIESKVNFGTNVFLKFKIRNI